jgi:hypothetical protein
LCKTGFNWHLMIRFILFLRIYWWTLTDQFRDSYPTNAQK